MRKRNVSWRRQFYNQKQMVNNKKTLKIIILGVI